MKRLSFFVSVLTFIIFSVNAYPCGGPEYNQIDFPLKSINEILCSIYNSDAIYDEYWSDPRDEFLFLYPFWLTHKETIEDLWNISYKGVSHESYDDNGIFREILEEESLTQTPDLASFELAISQKDWVKAKTVAEKIICQITDMPANQAQLHNAIFKRALEFWELAPHLGEMSNDAARTFFLSKRTAIHIPLTKSFQEALVIRDLKRGEIPVFLTANPHTARAASLQFVVLQETMKQQIPNGWLAQIGDKVSKETWSQLGTMIDDWLRRFSNHPLVDLVKLMKVRLYYFKGDKKAAFSVLLKMYPKHLPRVLAEMRHIVRWKSREVSEQIVDDETTDPVLRTALLSVVEIIKPEQWDKLWQLSEVNRKQPWAINLQERLLYLASKNSGLFPLLKNFPTEPDNLTQLWGHLRLVGLIENEQWDKAWIEAASLPEDETVAILKARYHIVHGNAWEAVKEKKLPWDAKRYLIDVLLSTEDLKKILPIDDNQTQFEVILTMAIREIDTRGWNSAADMIKNIDPKKAKLWTQCAELHNNNSPDGLLRWARFLKEHDGMIFYSNDKNWYRALNYRIGAISPIRKEWRVEYEKSAIERYLLSSTELWMALRTYIEYLSKVSPSPKSRKILKEADLCYNKLINYAWNSSIKNDKFWSNYFENNQLIAQLRKDGVRLRKK